MPRELRQMFTYLLLHCSPPDPLSLWTTFAESLSEDFSLDHPQDIAIQLALCDIDKLLKQNATSTDKFGLPVAIPPIILPPEPIVASTQSMCIDIYLQ